MKDNLFNEIKKSKGAFPPFYPEYRTSEEINCYAYALNLNHPANNEDFYTPGYLTALALNSDIYDDDINEDFLNPFSIGEYHYSEFEIDQFEKLLKRDCEHLGLRAFPCDFSKETGDNSYKIALCFDKFKYGWHFIRESVTFEKEKIWTHKLGWYKAPTEVRFSKDMRYVLDASSSKYQIKRCYEIFF